MVIALVILSLLLGLETALHVHIFRVVMGKIKCETCAKFGIGPKL